MQADVAAFLAINVDANFIRAQARRVLLWFRLGPDHVIGLFRRHALRKFPAMVGIKFPVWFLLVGAADSYLHAIDWLLTLPHRPKNEGVRIKVLAGLQPRGKRQNDQQGDREAGELREALSEASNLLPPPLPLLLLLHPRLRGRLPLS